MRTKRADSPVTHAASRRIRRFMRTHRAKITSTYLAQVCSDAGECMSFGKEFRRIARFFSNFVEFDYQSGPPRPLVTKSVNGLVFEVPYERNGFRVEAALKICRPLTSRVAVDNLFYEYLVGLFLNRYALRFPCFLHTYSVYLLSDQLLDLMRGTADHAIAAAAAPVAAAPVATAPVAATQLATSMAAANANAANAAAPPAATPAPDMANLQTYALNGHMEPIANTFDVPDLGESMAPSLVYESLEDADKFAILTQFFPRSRSLAEEIRRDPTGMAERSPYILYTIYSALRAIGNHRFVHYDMHLGNVLVVRLPPGQYIEYKYRSEDMKTRSFYLDVVVKLIDYGRCTFNAGVGESSMDIYHMVNMFIPMGGSQRGERLKKTYPFRFMDAGRQDVAVCKLAYWTAHMTANIPSTTRRELELMKNNLVNERNPDAAWRSAGQVVDFLRDAVLDKELHRAANADLFIGAAKIGELAVDETGHMEMQWTAAAQPTTPSGSSAVWATVSGGRRKKRRSGN